MTQQDCLSCDVIAGRRETPGGVIYEDEFWHLTHQVSPAQLRGFLILQPKRHVEQVGELSSGEASALGPILSAASLALNHVLPSRKVYVCSFGSEVVHVHFYLVPLVNDIPEDLKGGHLLDEVFTGRWACSDGEAAEVAARVRVELAKHAYL